MRFFLAILGIYGLYRLLRKERRRGPRGLLQDMRQGQGSRRVRSRGDGAPHVTYAVVEHDGGWAYKVDDVFSETYGTWREAARAAEHAAAAHQSAGSDEVIEYQDPEGRWHEEVEPGDRRPVTEVDVKPAPGA